MPNRVVHFEIHADDPERCAKFYTDVFGWDIKKWDSEEMEYWMVMTAPEGSKDLGINGGIMRRKGPAPTKGQATNSYVSTLQVDDYDAYKEKIESHGGKEVVEKWAIPGMAWQGYFTDTEGNIFGVHQPDENAK